ncbi:MULTISPECIES: LON peptidase substrate-binding domain-containing protein [Pseudoalteromonas]|uniref:LON peptidase substrate-binding domain-containing protein n=1 Tax=Pseudoalteromonas haloplanktis TaxID=228 RepID=A0ABU1B6N1_PSEHA|nr:MULTISPECIES: LON peptidase substrate-binding domain-containing protein [Pseudoalteromonas]MDQ9089975.1 LON peptidase substrate-binding domain-containing protein [Pseudoalteromonas haloplanktis]TMN73456.1 ATP-dependent protease [Pseudoalteromonas sp. S1727]
MKRAIFPLPVFILPCGYTRLRIFEPRYLEMVKESLKTEQGFVLCQYDIDSYLNVPKYGCLVDIIDFSQDKHGQLLIDVVATSVVEINDVCENKQQLRYGQLSATENIFWFQQPRQFANKDKYLQTALQQLFASNEQLNELYRETHFNELNWVVARWLELLPISIDKKQQLAFESDFANIHSFLHTVINNEFS